MPLARNKILINCWGMRGRTAAIEQEFEAAKYLGDEIAELGGGIANNKLLVEDGALHQKDIEAACAKVDAALDEFLLFMRGLNDTRRKWLDTKL